MKKDLLWLNGDIRKSNENHNLFHHGLHYGTGVFEGIRVYSGRPFLLEAHMMRLLASARRIGISCTIELETLVEGAQQVIKQNKCHNSYLRPLIWMGGPHLGILPDENKTQVAILAWDWPKIFDAEAASVGISVTTDVPFRRPPANVYPAGAKATAGYMTAMLNRRAAVSHGFDDALQLDVKGNVAEVTGANIFAVIDGELATPPPTCFLNGLTRQTIIAIAKAAGIDCSERTMSLDDIERADEIFVTGTAYEVLPVRRINHSDYAHGKLLKRLRSDFISLCNGNNIISTNWKEYHI